jgi:hypothetical protein
MNSATETAKRGMSSIHCGSAVRPCSHPRTDHGKGYPSSGTPSPRIGGTATGSDGATYNLETDMRAFKGKYVGADGKRHFGSFAFI